MSIANFPKSNDLDVEGIVDQVWSNLDGGVPRSIICKTVDQLLEEYEDAVIRIYVPLLVRREATDLLRGAVFQETKEIR